MEGAVKREGEAPAAIGQAGGWLAALRVPGYRRLLAVGFLWNLTRWLTIFLCTYAVNQLTGSPFLVQLVGAAFFAPMFFGGALGGVISDRLDRRRTILGLFALLVPSAGVVAAVTLAGGLKAWMVYPLMLAVGLGMVADMTCRRTLIFDLMGPGLVTNAIALESFGMMAGNTAASGMIAERQFCKKSNTTAATRMRESRSVWKTSRIDSRV